MYVIQAYQLIGSPLDEWVAKIFPWIELILGVFVILGLWTKNSLRGLLLMTSTFLFVVGQALMRHLPIDECGCFGKLLSFPLHVTFFIDCSFWIIIALLIIRDDKSTKFSLDEYFLKS